MHEANYPNGSSAMSESPGYLTPQERAVLALWLLIQVPMSTREISERCGMEMAGAWKMLNRISRVVPLYREGGKWRILRIS